MKQLIAAAFGLASLMSTQAALADNIVSYDVQGPLWWHQAPGDGAPTELTGRLSYNYTTNLFTQTDVQIGDYQFSLNPLDGPYTNQVVWHAVGIRMITTCALPTGQTCPNGVLSGNFVDLELGPLQVGDTASDSYTGYGTVPFQFMAILRTNGPTHTGHPDVAAYIGHGTVAAVPEPETYALMLAGLGLVAFIARRKPVRQ